MSFSNDLYTIIQNRVKAGYHNSGYPVYNMSLADAKSLEAVANKYGFPPQWLANLINFESAGTFNPAIQNSIGATGTIQFMPDTARSLGTTTDALKQMTFQQQMKYVDLYLQGNFNSIVASRGLYDKTTGKVNKNFTQTDLFMIIFYPVAVGQKNYQFPAYVTSANNGITVPTDYTARALANAPFKDVISYIQTAQQVVKRNPWPVIIIGVGAVGAITTILILAYKK